MSLSARWTEALNGLKAQGRFRSLKPPRGIDFTSNDYLGYGSGRLPTPLAALQGATSGLASRLLRGHHPVWDEVEATLAAWHGAESVLVMNSGFTANEGLISTVVEPGDWVASDELNHACIVEGLRVCRPRKFAFRHNDLTHLEDGLKKEAASRPPGREMFVITESLFSMDGDRAPLAAIVDLAERFGAHVIVDEAHSTGCYGPAGSGIVDELGMRSRVLATVHTGGKALGVTGAYICGAALLRDYLVNKCRHLIFTTALPPAIGSWWLDMIPKVRGDDAGRHALRANAARFHAALAERGVPTIGDSYIVPVVLGDDPRAVRVATALQERGYDIRAIRPPSVPQNTARLRISIHADHAPEVLDQLADYVAEALGQMNGFVVVGTDTDAGKTAFSLLFLTAFGGEFDYWKPVETGEPDSLRVRRLVPHTTVHEPLARFAEPVAPALAAKREGRPMPDVAEIVAAVPHSAKPLVIETFGGPLSPLTDDALQIELIRALGLPVVVVGSSAVGAVGRTLATLRAMPGVEVSAVALLGERDEYADEQIAKHSGVPVLSLRMPDSEWTAEALREASMSWRAGGVSPLLGVQNRGLTPLARLGTRDRASVWHPYTSLADPTDPLPVVAAEREFLHLADGRTLIDAISSWWTILHGHRHPPLVDALHRAADTLDHVLFAGVTHPPAVELAELMLASIPWKGGRVFFSDNGSTAVEVALKMAYQFWCHRGEPQRTLFVGFENGYHGDTFGAMAVGRDPLFFGTFEPLLFRAVQVPVNAERLDSALKANAGTVAAVILEPLVQGAGGMRMHTPEELRAIFEVTKRHGVLFIADEVMTGCRTGRLWAHSHAGIAPDLICTAKTLAGGMLPLAATLASPEIVSAFDTPDRAKTFFHGHSFTANPLACAVAVANWKLLAGDAWQRDAARIGMFWRTNLEPLRNRPGVKDVRICGTIAAIELDVPGGYLAEVGPRIRALAVERGVLLRPLGSVVYAMPPLCTSDESLARIAEVACGFAGGTG